MHLLCVAVAAVLLSACGNSSLPGSGETIAFGGVGAPPIVRSGLQPNGTIVQPPSGQPNTGPITGFTPEEDIHFTDPDNPEESLTELSAVLAENAAKRGPWEQSITIARRRAMREGKPLLIWFTDSERSPKCKTLSRELFSTKKFEKWAQENVIRLQVDPSTDISEMNLSLAQQETMLSELRTYVNRLKKKYRVMGTPSLVLLSPSGAVTGRYRGYQKGESEFTWGLIKQGVVSANHSYKAWRKDLEKRGYREWTDRRGRTVFAKLVQYDKGTLTLIEPDGARSETHESKLSSRDKEWIAEQKEKRGIQ